MLLKLCTEKSVSEAAAALQAVEINFGGRLSGDRPCFSSSPVRRAHPHRTFCPKSRRCKLLDITLHKSYSRRLALNLGYSGPLYDP